VGNRCIDVLVVGAGPAGATCARKLAAAGRETTLIEARRIPRHKPCGGGVPVRTIRELGIDISPAVETHVTSVAIDGAWNGRHVMDLRALVASRRRRPEWPGPDEVETPGPMDPRVVERSRLDEFLVRKAVAAGAELREGVRLRGVRRAGDGFRVETTAGELRARTLCACDGVFSPTARALGFAKNRACFCLEGVVPMRADLGPSELRRAIFNMASVQAGYAWALPRREDFAVGIGSVRPKDATLRRRLERFVARTPELRGSPLERVQGGMLPLFFGARPRYAREGAYLIGDAAGLVDPFSGEGIYHAVLSARFAAEAILDGGEAAYEERLARKVISELKIARWHSRFLTRVPRWLVGPALCIDWIRDQSRFFVEALSGRATYRGIFRAIHGRRPRL
jgi:geranylgeranyl reductase family protein